MMGWGIEFLGAIAVGAGAGAMIFALMHALRKAGFSLARWLLPAGIGLAMIGYSVWNDYTWFARKLAGLPENTTVLWVGYDSQPWAPWTYLAPVAVGFTALDPASISDAGGLRRARIIAVERRGPTILVPQEYDCDAGMIRQAGSEWTRTSSENPAFVAICGGNSG